jgi:hypothetical protein
VFWLYCRRFICWQAQAALYGLFWYVLGSPAASMGVSLPVVFRRFLGLVLALYAVAVNVRSWRRVCCVLDHVQHMAIWQSCGLDGS